MAKKSHKQPEKLFTAEKLASGAWKATKTLGVLAVGAAAISWDVLFRPASKAPLSVRTKTVRIGDEFRKAAPPADCKPGLVTGGVMWFNAHVEAIPPIHGTYAEDLKGISPGTQDIIIAQRALRETHGIDSNQL